MVVATLAWLAAGFLLRRPRGVVDAAERMHRCCARIVRALGVEWSVRGELPRSGAVVSNHLSYLDVLLFAAVRPFVMVAKSEVAGWPLIGWMTRQAGTVFVVRGGGPPTWPGVNRAMAEAYRSGLPVLFFPEGTTTDGASVLEFRRGLFHSVLNEGAALRTAALGYSLSDDCGATVEEDVCWIGDATLAPHLLRLAGLKGVRAEIRFGDEVPDRSDRFVLSRTARERVMEMAAGLRAAASGEVRTAAGEAELVEAVP